MGVAVVLVLLAIQGRLVRSWFGWLVSCPLVDCTAGRLDSLGFLSHVAESQAVAKRTLFSISCHESLNNNVLCKNLMPYPRGVGTWPAFVRPSHAMFADVAFFYRPKVGDVLGFCDSRNGDQELRERRRRFLAHRRRQLRPTPALV